MSHFINNTIILSYKLYYTNDIKIRPRIIEINMDNINVLFNPIKDI